MKKIFSALLICTMILCISGVSYGADVGTTTNSDEISFNISDYNVELVSASVELENYESNTIVNDRYSGISNEYDAIAGTPLEINPATIHYEIEDYPNTIDKNNLSLNATTPLETKHRARHVGKLITNLFIINLDTINGNKSYTYIGPNTKNSNPKLE